MRTSKIQILILLTIALATPALQRVGKRSGVHDMALKKDDTFAIDMNMIFDYSRVSDLSKLTFRVMQSNPTENDASDVGTLIVDPDQPFADFQYDASKLGNFIYTKQIDERSFLIFTDSGKVVYEETSATGFPYNAEPEKVKVFDTKLIGSKIACQDGIRWGNTDDQLVIACISKDVIVNDMTIYLQILDRATFMPVGDLISQKFGADSDFRIFNQINLIRVWVKDAKMNYVPYLLVTDKGNSNKNPDPVENPVVVRDNTHFQVFSIVDSVLTWDNEYYIVRGEKTFDWVQNYFFEDEKLIVISKFDSLPNYQISQCTFVPQMKSSNDYAKIDCGNAEASLGFTTGYVEKMDGEETWAQIKLNDDNTTIDLTIFNPNHSYDNPQVWSQLNQMKGIKLPDDALHKWIRRIQGTQSQVIIQYTSMDGQTVPAATKDSDATLITFYNGNATNHPGWSVNIHSSNLYYVKVDAAEYSVARISGPWWFVTGDKLNTNMDNVVSFTASEPGVNSVTVSCTFYQAVASQGFEFDWNPPYLDVHQNSLVQIPYDNQSVKRGNNLDYAVSFSNKQFYKTDIFHSQEINVTFNQSSGEKMHKTIKGESNDNAYASIQFVEGGGAATVDNGGKMFLYTCDMSRGTSTCTAINTKAIDIQGKTNEILQDSAFGSASFQAYSNTFIGGGSKQQGQTYVYYNLRGSKDIVTKNVEYLANDVAFTTNKDGDLYIAFSYLSVDSEQKFTLGSQVEVYMVSHTDPTTWTLTKTLDWAALQVVRFRDFCPVHLKFDRKWVTDLHILSNCAFTQIYKAGAKIFTIDVENNSVSSIKPTVDIDLAPGKEISGRIGFCPFADNFLVYALDLNIVIMTSKRPSLNHYTIPLTDFGYTSTVDFHCMSNIGMYGVRGTQPTENGTAIIYGLFWGNVGYNNGKFVNQIWSNLDPAKFSDTMSYGIDWQVLTVDYAVDSKGAHTAGSILQTLVEPPMIFTTTGDFGDQQRRFEKGTITITATAPLFKKDLVADIWTIKQDFTIRPVNNGGWTQRYGTIFVEDYCRLTGPITDITITPNKGSDITFVDRKRSEGTLAITDNKIVFSEYRGSIDHGFGLTPKPESDQTTFSLVDNGVITKQFDLPRVRAADATAFLQQADSRLVVASMATSNGEAVQAFSVDDSGQSILLSSRNTGTRADKIRVNKFMGKYIAFGLDASTGILSTWEIKNQNNDLVFSLIDQTTNVKDFDPASSNTSLYNYFIRDHDSNVYEVQYSPVQGGIDVSDALAIPLDRNRPYWLQSIACNNNSANNGAVCAVNTFGTVLIAFQRLFPEQIKSKGNQLTVSLQMYEKLAGFDGAMIFIDDEFIAHRVYNMKTGGNLTAYANIYSRTSGNQLHTQIAILNSEESNDTILNSILMGKSLLEIDSMLAATVNTRAMSYFYKEDVQKKVVAVGQNDPANPLAFFSLRNSFTVFNKESTDFTKYSVVINGDTANAYNLDQLLNNTEPVPTSSSSGGSSSGGSSSPDVKPASIWVFVGILVVLVILSVAWFAYARSKSASEEEDEGIYKSVNPTSKTEYAKNEFETGLDPEEDGEDALN